MDTTVRFFSSLLKDRSSAYGRAQVQVAITKRQTDGCPKGFWEVRIVLPDQQICGTVPLGCIYSLSEGRFKWSGWKKQIFRTGVVGNWDAAWEAVITDPPEVAPEGAEAEYRFIEYTVSDRNDREEAEESK